MVLIMPGVQPLADVQPYNATRLAWLSPAGQQHVFTESFSLPPSAAALSPAGLLSAPAPKLASVFHRRGARRHQLVSLPEKRSHDLTPQS